MNIEERYKDSIENLSENIGNLVKVFYLNKEEKGVILNVGCEHRIIMPIYYNVFLFANKKIICPSITDVTLI